MYSLVSPVRFISPANFLLYDSTEFTKDTYDILKKLIYIQCNLYKYEVKSILPLIKKHFRFHKLSIFIKIYNGNVLHFVKSKHKFKSDSAKK